MRLKQLACIVALALPFSAQSDTLSVTIGGGIWDESPTGTFQKTTDPLPVDVVENLFWDNEAQNYVFVSLEHFIPIIPNFRLIRTNIDHTGNGLTTFNFNGLTFTGNVNNDISITTTDLIAYYEVLDNVVSLDLGLVIRNLKVDYTITGGGSTTTDSLNETVPMLYALIGASPWPDLTISGELSYVAASGSSISDFTAKIAYTTNFMVGIEAGYRIQNFEFDDISSTNANMDFDGIFAGAYLKF